MDQFVGGKSSLRSFFTIHCTESSLCSFFGRILPDKSSVTSFLRSLSLVNPHFVRSLPSIAPNPHFVRSSEGSYRINPQSLRSFVLYHWEILTSFVLYHPSHRILATARSSEGSYRINPQSLRSFFTIHRTESSLPLVLRKVVAESSLRSFFGR